MMFRAIRNRIEAVTVTKSNCRERPLSVTRLTGTTAGVTKVIFLPEEKLVLVACDDRAVRIYDIDNASEPRASFTHHKRGVHDVVQLDSDLVASVGEDIKLFSWCPTSAQLVGQWKHNSSLYSVAKLGPSR